MLTQRDYVDNVIEQAVRKRLWSPTKGTSRITQKRLRHLVNVAETTLKPIE